MQNVLYIMANKWMKNNSKISCNKHFKNCKSISVVHSISKRKDKNYIIISIGAEKALDKIKYSFMIKTHIKCGIEGTYINTMKTIYDEPTTTIMLKGTK